MGKGRQKSRKGRQKNRNGRQSRKGKTSSQKGRQQCRRSIPKGQRKKMKGRPRGASTGRPIRPQSKKKGAIRPQSKKKGANKAENPNRYKPQWQQKHPKKQKSPIRTQRTTKKAAKDAKKTATG